MGKKLYESNTIRSVANALRNKVKEYYTFTKDGAVDEAGAIDNFDGTNTNGAILNKGTKVTDGKAKYPSMTTPTGKGFWYEYDYMLKELAPMPDDGRWPVPGDDFDKEAPRYNKTVSGFITNDLGILNLTTRLGFPEGTTARRIDIKNKFGASGAKYTVPDNGWVFVSTSSARAGKRLQITNLTSLMVAQGQTNAWTSYNNQSAAGTNNVKFENKNAKTNTIYLIMPCARYDEVQIDYKTVSLSLTSSFVITDNESNGTMTELTVYFIPAKKTNYDKTYVDPRGDTTIPENNQLTLGKNMPFEVTLSGGTYTALSDGWFYAMDTNLGGAQITINCTSNGMVCTSSETDLTVDKGCIQQQASNPTSGPGKQPVVNVKSYPYCFMPMAKDSKVTVTNGKKFYFLNAI